MYEGSLRKSLETKGNIAKKIEDSWLSTWGWMNSVMREAEREMRKAFTLYIYVQK